MGLGNWIFKFVCGAGTLAGVAVAILYIFQEKILYVPRIPGVEDEMVDPESYLPNLKTKDEWIMTEDGIRIHAWLMIPRKWTAEYTKSRPVILFFQENAGNMSYRLPYLKLLIRYLECPVLAVSYRGYGISGGRPTESGLKKDAQASLSHLAQHPDVNGSKIVVFGRSLGGAVAIHLAAERPKEVAALIIENTFTSVEDMVPLMVPPLGALVGTGKPMNFLVTNKWRNNEKIKEIKTTPLLMIISELDETIPPEHMYQLYSLQKTNRCQLAEVPGAHHMDAYAVAPLQYWGSIKGFLTAYILREHDLSLQP